jgi:hypothetical protein
VNPRFLEDIKERRAIEMIKKYCSSFKKEKPKDRQ